MQGSEREINMPHNVRMSMERLHARLSRPGLEDDVDPSVFDPVEAEICSMIALNIFPVYKSKGGV